MTACQGVFCGGVKNSTIALPRPPSLFLFPSLSPCLIHHLPLHPSSHCRLLLNVSPNSPNISLTFHSIVPPLQLSLAHTLPFSLPVRSLGFLRSDAFIAKHLRLQTDAPLILLFCNLQRGRKSCSTCVTFKQLHQSILYIHTFSLLNLSEVAGLCYLFSLYSQIHYSGRMDKNRAEGKGNRPCGVPAQHQRRRAGYGRNMQGVGTLIVTHLQDNSVTNGDIEKSASCFFSYDFGSFVSERAKCSVSITSNISLLTL